MSEATASFSTQPDLPETQIIFDESGRILPDIQKTILEYYRAMPHEQRVSHVREAMQNSGSDYRLAAKIGQSAIIAKILHFKVPDSAEFLP